MNYRCRHLKRAVNLSEIGVNYIYKVYILTAMRWLNEVWNDVTEETIFHCWRMPGIVVRTSLSTVATSSVETNTGAQIQEKLSNTVTVNVPEACRISI